MGVRVALDIRWKKSLLGLLNASGKASVEAAQFSSALKKKVLEKAAQQLKRRASYLLRENRKDLACAKAAGLSSAMIDRLTLTSKRIEEMAEGVQAVASL